MIRPWDDVDARARGLGTHLLGRARIETLAASPDIASLAAELARAGYPVAAAARPSVFELELAARRVSARSLGILARWAAERAAALVMILEEEVRSVRALVRGAASGVPAERRLAGLLPTPSLPERALEELAQLGSPADVAALLVTWQSPWGRALLPEARGPHPDLFALEAALDRSFSARVRVASRRVGLALEHYAREVIDLRNASAAILLAAEGRETDPMACFLEGGAWVDRRIFEQASRAADSERAAHILARALDGTVLASALLRAARDPGVLELAALRALVREHTRALRRVPLGGQSLVTYALRLRAEAIDVRTIIWGVALGAPRAELTSQLVSV